MGRLDHHLFPPGDPPDANIGERPESQAENEKYGCDQHLSHLLSDGCAAQIVIPGPVYQDIGEFA